MKLKKLLIPATIACLTLANGALVFASTGSNYLSNYSSSLGSTISGYDWSNWGSGSGSTGSSGFSGWNWGSWGTGSGTTNPGTGGSSTTATLPAPVVGITRYNHQKLYTSDNLQITWEAVDGAASYEIEVTSPAGLTVKTYSRTGTSMSISKGSDSLVGGCMKGGKVRIRAIDKNGKAGTWSKQYTISCNSLH